MSYKDKYSITEIQTSRDNERFSLSIDPDDGVMILHVPNVNKFDHEHINITEKGLKDLHEWLTEYFKDKE